MIPKKASSLYKQVSEDLDVDQILVENFIDFYYKKIRECLINLTHPIINVDGLGQFVVKTNTVKKAIPRYRKSLENHDTSTFGAYFNKKRIELKLDLLIVLEQKILLEEKRKENFKKQKDEEYTKTNLGQPETDN
jgi:hypothetical protein